MTPSGEDVYLYDEARRAYRAKDLEKLKSIYEQLMEIKEASPEIVYIVRRMIEELSPKTN